MTTVFKSVNSANSPFALPNVISISYSVDQLYELYADEVDRDGGQIIDAVATRAAITYAKENNLYGKMKVAASARWGVKLAGGRIEKLYSLEGQHLLGVAVGSGGSLPEHTTDANDYPVALLSVDGSRNGGILRTANPITLAYSDADFCAIAVNQNELDDLSVQTAFGNVPTSGTGYAAAIIGRTSSQTNGTAQTDAYDPAAAPSAGNRIVIAGGRNAIDAVGTALALRISTGTVNLINNGAVIKTETSGTGKLTDYKTLTRHMYFGSTYDGSANITANRKGHLRECCIFSQISLALLQEFTSELTRRYA